MRAGFCFTLCSMLVLGFGLPAHAQESAAIDVSLGDVSLNKVAFLVAKDNGIYKK
jgi:NitT/TauT family transport system substrate-binding protein